MRVSFIVIGKVQGVMFRKTFCLGAKKRGLLAGATNLDKRTEVLCSLEGDQSEIEKLIKDLTTLEKLNSWGASVDRVESLSEYHQLKDHDYDNLEIEGELSTGGVEVYL